MRYIAILICVVAAVALGGCKYYGPDGNEPWLTGDEQAACHQHWLDDYVWYDGDELAARLAWEREHPAESVGDWARR